MTVDIQHYSTSSFPPPIDLTDAIQDSPRFRRTLGQHNAYFTKLEMRLTEMLKHVSSMIEYSKNYVTTFYKFTVSVNQLCDESFSGNALAQASFQSLSEAFGTTLNLSRTYYEQTNVIMYTKLSNFLKEELAKVQDARNLFDSMSTSMDEALQKNAGATKTKPADAADGRNALTAVGACFAHTTLDYVAQINIAHAHKDHIIIDALWSLVRESSAFFSKGHAIFDEWTAADNGAVADTISAFAAKSKLVERKMQDVHSLVPKTCDPLNELAAGVQRLLSFLSLSATTKFVCYYFSDNSLQRYAMSQSTGNDSRSTSAASCGYPHYVTVCEFYDVDPKLSPSRAITVKQVVTRHLVAGEELQREELLQKFERRESTICRRRGVRRHPEEGALTLTNQQLGMFFRREEEKKDPVEVIMFEAARRHSDMNNITSVTIGDDEDAGKHSIVELERSDTEAREEMFQHPSGMPIDADVMMEGYLYKRSSNAFKTWNRRWFQIKENKLLYLHRSNDQEPPTVMEENLMLCLVRPAPTNIDRVGCFELVTPTRCHLLQADSLTLCSDWMRAIQRTIHALHENENGLGTSTSTNRFNAISSQSSSKNTSNSAPPKVTNGCKNVAISTFEQIRKVDGNDVCADCGSPAPKWVCINLGVVLCIECSGVHRSLGVQLSKVRSLTMDSIDGDLKDVLLALGNKNVNSAYLKYLPKENVVPPPCTGSSSRAAREAWIKAKYVERRFAVDSEERARTSAASRQEPLLRHKTSLVNGSVNRSASYADVKDADQSLSKLELSPDVDPWAADLSIPQSVKRLSSCGSDTAIDGASQSTEIVSAEASKADWDAVAEAATTGNVLFLLCSHAHGFDLNALHSGTSLLHIAVRNGQSAAVEFLLLNGAKINMLDDKMNTPLHLASLQGNTLQVCQLLKRGADKNLMNVDGKTPLDIAVEGKFADIVTLFRVTDMRDEFSECNNPMDKTVDDVISDIARRAATEKAATCT